MNLNDYEIKGIESVNFIGHKIIEKNIPESIEVSQHEFNVFIKNRSLIYERVRSGYFPDTIEYYDKYDNNVASRTVDEGKSYSFYFINPELYEKGQKEKRKIVNVYSDKEEVLCSLDHTTLTVLSETVDCKKS